MIKELHSIMSELVTEHKKTYDEDSMRNLTDVYLKQIKESNDPAYSGKFQSRIIFLFINNYNILNSI